MSLRTSGFGLTHALVSQSMLCQSFRCVPCLTGPKLSVYVPWKTPMKKAQGVSWVTKLRTHHLEAVHKWRSRRLDCLTVLEARVVAVAYCLIGVWSVPIQNTTSKRCVANFRDKIQRARDVLQTSVIQRQLANVQFAVVCHATR